MASKHMEYNYFNLDDVLKKEAKKKEKKLAKKKKEKGKKAEDQHTFGQNLDENVGITDTNEQHDDNLMAIAKQLQHNHDQQEKQEKKSSERIKISFT
ncbi:hypothetical protein D3C73_1429270 [compost metagenome]